MTKKGAILVISGPSGSGKSTLCEELKNSITNVYFSVSTTTRAKRDYEEEGVHYHFVSKERFIEGIESDEFLEWAEIHGNFYGTSKIEVKRALDKGYLVVFDIDVQGHQNIRKEFDEITTSVFILTKTRTDLIERLKSRGSETDESINTRVAHAIYELKKIDEYDYIIINDDFKESAKKLQAIAVAALCKSSGIDKKELLDYWMKH